MNILNIAISIAKATGIDKLIGRLFSSKNAEKIASTVAAIAMQSTQTATPEEALKAVQSNKAQSDAFRLAIIDRIVELEMLANEDRKNAREIQIATLEKGEGWFATNFVYLLALFWSIVSVVYIFGITFSVMPAGAGRYADMILGFLLGTVIAGILSFFFGGSLKPPLKSR